MCFLREAWCSGSTLVFRVSGVSKLNHFIGRKSKSINYRIFFFLSFNPPKQDRFRKRQGVHVGSRYTHILFFIWVCLGGLGVVFIIVLLKKSLSNLRERCACCSGDGALLRFSALARGGGVFTIATAKNETYRIVHLMTRTLKLTYCSTWKWMVGICILVSFWDGLVSGSMLVSLSRFHGSLVYREPRQTDLLDVVWLRPTGN